MADLIPLRGISTPGLARAAEQSFRQWRVEYQSVREHEIPKWIRDHFASVSEFRIWKADHPRDGTMTVLYRWTPIVGATFSVLSINPIGLGFIPGLLGRRSEIERVEG